MCRPIRCPMGRYVCLLVPTVPYTTATYGETPCLGRIGYGRYSAGTKHLYGWRMPLVSGLFGAGCDGDRQVSPGLTIEVSPPSWNPAGCGYRYVSPHTGGGARNLPQVDVGFLFRQARCGRKARSDPPGRSVPGSRVGSRAPAGPDAGVSWLRFELRKPTDCTRR